jgi:putative membrane protein
MSIDLSMPSGVHHQLQPWSLPLPLTIALALVALVYFRGWFRLRSVPRTALALSRLTAFVGGLFAVWIALGSPLAPLDEQSLTVHMVKHLLLMALGAPLILLGMPRLPLMYGLPKRFRSYILLLRSRTPQWVLHGLSNPFFCWAAGTAAVIGWHLPALFHLALSSHIWHIVEHTCFLAAGLLFWRPVFRPWPSESKSSQWSVPLYLFLATLPCDILSGFLVFCGRVAYTSYQSAPRVFNLSVLQDQQCAGALMWVWVTFAYLIPAVVITVQILSPTGVQTQQAELGVVPGLTRPSVKTTPRMPDAIA